MMMILCKIKVIPNKVCVMNFTQLNTVYFETIKSSSEDESIDSKYTVFNCVESHVHFVRNYFNFIRAETISR